LLEAWQHPDRLEGLADTSVNGRRLHVVSYAIPDRTETIRLLLDAETSLLTGVAQRVDFAGLGDATSEMVYDRYQRRDGLGWFPSGHQLRLNGAVFQQLRYTSVAVNDPASLAAFEIPEEMRGFTATPDSARAIAPGVHIYSSPQGFNALFVAFRDFVLAVEAPGRAGSLGEIPYDTQAGNSTISGAMIQRIHQTVPGTPIRYLAVTHYHSDHAGVLRGLCSRPGHGRPRPPRYCWRRAGDRDHRSQAGTDRRHPHGRVDQRRGQSPHRGVAGGLASSGADPVSG
jgi:hypothetical protein